MEAQPRNPRRPTVLISTTATFAQQTPDKKDPRWLLPVPEVKADLKIPTFNSIIGHAWAEDISSHAEVERYLNALAKAAPDRTKLVKYGQTYQRKSLYYLIISSPANLQRIEHIRKNNLALTDPRRTKENQAERIVDGNQYY